jgi:drug/metabolite transporter (DMT)-like permease
MDNLRGIALMVASMAGFSVEDALIKGVAAHVPTGQIIIILGLIGAAFFGTLAKTRGLRLFGPALFQRSVVTRNLSEMIGTVCYVSSFVLAPLSIASAILQATPLVVTLGAALFLGAPVGWRRWTAIAVGLIGVLIIVRPGGDGFHPASLLAVASVIFLAVRDLATRTAPPHVASLVMAFYGCLSTVPAAAVLLWFQGGWVTVPPEAAMHLLLAAGVGVAAYYAIIAAMRTGEVAIVTPFRYSRIVFALILGMTFFGERLDLWTLIGAAVVVFSGLYTLLREARLIRAARA